MRSALSLSCLFTHNQNMLHALCNSQFLHGRTVVSFRFIVVIAILSFPLPVHAQLSFTSAIDLALRNSPRVKIAQDDVQKALAVLVETRDVYIPSVSAGLGLGASSGITLNVPTLFTISAQSLVYNPSQRDYIRAARLGLKASGQALVDVRQQVEEDTAVTYLGLDSSLQRHRVMAEELAYAQKLVSIMDDRFSAGVESDLEMKKARRTAIQIRLQQLQLDDQIASLRDHLARLTGISGTQMTTVSDSIPASPVLTQAASASAYPDSPNLLSAQINAQAKATQAFGDARNTWRPQIAFQAQYGRISPFNGVSTYYNLNGDYNTLGIGVQIQIPFLDRGRKAKARESEVDALHATHEADFLHVQQEENRIKLQHSIAELSVRAELAELDQNIAQDQLNIMDIQLNTESSATPMTPRDEQNARIQERQKYLDLLDTTFQLRQTQIDLLRQTGELETWLRSPLHTQTTNPANP